jgi:uncharacterized membrane protein HdeD (DUF308 family)
LPEPLLAYREKIMSSNLYWIGYVLGAVMVIMGVLILSGFFALRWEDGGDSTLRTVFGIVLLLYGVYRIVLTTMQRRRRERES